MGLRIFVLSLSLSLHRNCYGKVNLLDLSGRHLPDETNAVRVETMTNEGNSIMFWQIL